MDSTKIHIVFLNLLGKKNQPVRKIQHVIVRQKMLSGLGHKIGFSAQIFRQMGFLK